MPAFLARNDKNNPEFRQTRQSRNPKLDCDWLTNPSRVCEPMHNDRPVIFLDRLKMKKKFWLAASIAATVLMLCAGSLQAATAKPYREQGVHNTKGVTCKDCHLVEKPNQKPSSKACLDCHGSYDKVAKLTSKLHANPHDSHLGPIDCLKCHSIHDLPEQFEGPCVECHADFEFKVK
jgi:hypothetical protein